MSAIDIVSFQQLNNSSTHNCLIATLLTIIYLSTAIFCISVLFKKINPKSSNSKPAPSPQIIAKTNSINLSILNHLIYSLPFFLPLNQQYNHYNLILNIINEKFYPNAIPSKFDQFSLKERFIQILTEVLNNSTSTSNFNENNLSIIKSLNNSIENYQYRNFGLKSKRLSLQLSYTSIHVNTTEIRYDNLGKSQLERELYNLQLNKQILCLINNLNLESKCIGYLLKKSMVDNNLEIDKLSDMIKYYNNQV